MTIIFIIIILFYIFFAVYMALMNNWKMISFFLIVILFQNLIGIFFYKNVNSLLISIFYLIKEGMLYLAVLIAILKKGKIKYSKKIGYFVIIYSLVMAKNLIFTKTGLYSAFVSLRYLILPVIGVAVGYNLYINKVELNKLFRFLINYSGFVAITGIIEFFLFGDKFWVSIGYSEYAVGMKGATSLYNGVSRNFYTWDFFGIAIRRVITITADPLASAFLIFLGLAILVTGCVKIKTRGKYNQWIFYVLLLFILSLCSLSKAIFVFMAIVLFVLFYYNYWIPKFLIKGIIAISAIILTISVSRYMNELTHATSVSNHVNGLLNGFKSAGIMGNGLGTAGATVQMLTQNSTSSTESFIGTIVSQTGYVGLLSFVLFGLYIFNRLIYIWKIYHNKFSVLCITFLLGLLVCMMFSESSVSVMGTGIYFILVGIGMRKDIYEE